MGRKPSKPGAIPRFRPRKQKSGKVCHYYDHGVGPDGKRREEPLGSDYGLAIQRAAIDRNRDASAAYRDELRRIVKRHERQASAQTPGE